MIKVENIVKAYDTENADSSEKDLYISESGDKYKIKLVIENITVYVDAGDLLVAIKNATNVNRY